MKALSVHRHWAELIAVGLKTLEVRSKRTNYRGPLLICSTRKPVVGYETLPGGVMVCVVDVVGDRPMVPSDVAEAGCDFEEKRHVWILANPRRVRPLPVRGRQGFYTVPDEQVVYDRVVYADMPIASDLERHQTGTGLEWPVTVMMPVALVCTAGQAGSTAAAPSFVYTARDLRDDRIVYGTGLAPLFRRAVGVHAPAARGVLRMETGSPVQLVQCDERRLVAACGGECHVPN